MEQPLVCEVCGDLAPRYRMGCMFKETSKSWTTPYCALCIDLTLLSRNLRPDDAVITLIVDGQVATASDVAELITIQKAHCKSYGDRIFV